MAPETGLFYWVLTLRLKRCTIYSSPRDWAQPQKQMNHLTNEIIKDITERALDSIDDQTGRLFNKFIDKQGEQRIAQVIEQVLLQSRLTY